VSAGVAFVGREEGVAELVSHSQIKNVNVSFG